MKRLVFMVAATAAWAALACGKGKDTEGEARPPEGQQPIPGPGGTTERKPIARPPGALLKPTDLARARRADLAALAFEDAAVDARVCLPAAAVDPATIDVDRSLFVHDRATLDALGPDAFSLQRTLAKIASDAVAAGATGATSETLFRDLWDTQNPRATGATPGGSHCDDDGTTLNGFPNACRQADGAQAKAASLPGEIAAYRPIALVNRLDLAAEGWKNCGEHRIVYGRIGAGVERNFIIFEAVLPNPRPGCRSGCRPVAQRWYELSAIDSPQERARRLEELFYTGLPGFRPVVHVDHYSAKGPSTGYGGAGSGQVRTNQFFEVPWMLKEFKLVVDCSTSPCALDPVPIPAKTNPHGPLWVEATDGLAKDFQEDVVLPQVGLLAGGLNDFSYEVPVVYDAARSDAMNGGIEDNYAQAYGSVTGVAGGFKDDLRTAVNGSAVSDVQLVNRATALSCAGCHQPSTFGLLAPDSIGAGLSWPDSASFVHVRAEDAGGVHTLSPALTGTFLPARKQHLADFLGARTCLCRFRKPMIDIPRLRQPPFPRPPRTAGELRDAEEKLGREINRELRRRGQAQLPELTLGPKAQPLVLDDVKKAGPDPARQAIARARAVRTLVLQEPPRKTVTGHFRTH